MREKRRQEVRETEEKGEKERYTDGETNSKREMGKRWRERYEVRERQKEREIFDKNDYPHKNISSSMTPHSFKNVSPYIKNEKSIKNFDGIISVIAISPLCSPFLCK